MRTTSPSSRRTRPRRPLAVTVVEQSEPIDFAAWAARYAAIVVRLYQEDTANQAAA